MKDLSVEKDRYFVTFYDETSAASAERFIQTKDKSGPAVKNMTVEMNSVAANRAKVRRIRMNSSEKYIEKDLENWFIDFGITLEYSPTYSLSPMAALNF